MAVDLPAVAIGAVSEATATIAMMVYLRPGADRKRIRVSCDGRQWATEEPRLGEERQDYGG
jgi:hypothetical protein